MKQLDIVFIEPNSSRQSYQGLADLYAAIETPTWSLLLAQSCRSKGFSVSILDANAERLTDEQVATRVEDLNPRLVCFVVYGQNPNSGTTNMSGALSAAREVKNRGYKIAFVGSHSSALPKEVLSFDCVDIVLTNEGVYALHNLLKSDLSKDLKDIKGIGWKPEGEPILNTPERIVPQERMVEDLPGYAWDLLPYKNKPFDLYRSHFWHSNYDLESRTPFAAIYTSFGCKFKCEFCLDENTKIILSKNRNKKIKDIKIGDKVLSFDTNNSKIVESCVTKISSRFTEKLLKITLSDGKVIKATEEHPFYSNGEWIQAKDLKIGNKCLVIEASKNCPHLVEIKNIEVLIGNFHVFNFQCDDYNNYFAENILTHNCMINILNRTDNRDDAVSSDFNVMRFWPSEFIIKEFEKLQNYGVTNIRISDEMFFLDKRHFSPLIDLILERNLKFNMWAYSRVDTCKKEWLEKFKRAGINWLALGIESGNQNIRLEITKGSFKDVNIRDIVKTIQENDINVVGNYIFGFPNENELDLNTTFELAVDLNTEFANMYCAAALPGSPLYMLAKKNGWDLPRTFEEYGFYSYDCKPLPTKFLSAKDVLAFRDSAWLGYNLNERYLSLIEKKFGVVNRKNIEDQTKIKLKRRLLEC